MFLKTIIVAGLCLVAYATQSRASDAGSLATERTSALIKRCDGPLSKKQPEQFCVDAFFDFGAIARGALAPHQAALGPARYAKCTSAFTQVLRARARGASAALGKAVIDTSNVVSADSHEVPLTIHDERAQETRHVTLRWEKGRNSLMQVVDVKLEDASIILDYRNQFARILKKNGPDALLKKIEERLPTKK